MSVIESVSGLVRVVVFTLVLLAACAEAARPAPSEQVPIGPRAIAMGGAYSSIAQDASALFWNPAGISWIGHQEVAVTYANLFQSDIKDNYAAFVLPISHTIAVGSDWYHSGFDDAELAFGENRFDLSVATQFDRRIAVGVTGKYLTRDTDLDGSQVAHGSGVGMDIGVLATPVHGLRLGAVGQDVFDTEVNQADGSSSVAYPHSFRVAASYDWRDRATVAFDVDDRWHAGAEVRGFDLVALRAGIAQDLDGGDGATLTAGVGLHYGIFRFDYAYEMPPTLSATSHFGLAMAFNFNPSQVRVEKIEPEELYASQYRTYSRVPIGQVNLRNLSGRMLEARLKVEIPGYMDAPTEKTITLDRGATTPVPLFADFNPHPMTLRESARPTIQVSVSYNSDRLVRTDRMNGALEMYAPGAIDWSRGVDQAAAFITTEDPVVATFARDAVRALPESGSLAFPSREAAKAAAILDAVAALGVRYVEDPNNPYPAMAESSAVDHVNYPRQTLAHRTGDCDDTSVLMAALLGNVGIPTKLVDVPGHLFILMDTGRHERDLVGLEDRMFVRADQGLWIPLETTKLQAGFAEAWRAGADAYETARATGTVKLVDVQEAQTRYEANLPTDDAAVAAVDTSALGRKLAGDVKAVAGWRAQYIAEHFGSVMDSAAPSADAVDEQARTLYLAGDATAALHLLDGTGRSARSLNNRGNVLLATGENDRAAAAYRDASALDPADGGIWLNRGLLALAEGDSTAADDFIARGIERAGGYEEAARLLGLRSALESGREGTPRMTRAQLRALLKKAIGAVPADSTRAHPGATSSKPRKLTPMTAGPHGDDLRLYLYWRERP